MDGWERVPLSNLVGFKHHPSEGGRESFWMCHFTIYHLKIPLLGIQIWSWLVNLPHCFSTPLLRLLCLLGSSACWEDPAPSKHAGVSARGHCKNRRITMNWLESIWMFQKIVGFTPKSSHFNGVFHYEKTILGAHPYFWKHPIYNLNLFSIDDPKDLFFKANCLRPRPLRVNLLGGSSHFSTVNAQKKPCLLSGWSNSLNYTENMDTQNYGLEKVTPFRYDHFLYNIYV